MESGHKSGGGGAAGGDGVLCHACGYQYPNGHPSAKQRRAHRKHCGKPASAAAADAAAEGAGEHEGGESLPGGVIGGVGEGIGASAAECGGGLPGSAPEAASAVDGGDSAEQSSGNGTGHQVIGDESAEDHLISSSNIPSEITSEASKMDDDNLTTVDTQYSEKETPIEDGDPSDPAVGSEQLKDVPTSILLSEPEDGAKCTSEISEHGKQNSLSEYETQNSTAVPLESNATGGGTSEQMDDVASQVDGTAVTEEDDTINTIGKNKFSEDKSIDGDDFDLSCQENLQTKIGEEHSNTGVVEESSDKNLNAIHNKEIPSDEAESNQQNKLMITDSFENIANIDVPVESSTEKSVGTEDDMLKLGTVGSHSETPDVKPQQQPDSTSETEGHLAVSEGADNVDEQHYPISVGGIPALSSAFGPAVGGTANVTENICSSGVTMDGSMQQNVTAGTVVTSQVDIVELSTPAMPHEINMVARTNNVDENRQNEKDGTDLTSYGGNELHIVENFEEKQENKEVIVDPIPHEANTASSVVQSMSSAEEKEQIEEFIANLAPEVTSVTSSRDIVEEKQGEIDVKTSGEIDGARSMETAGENNAATWEINAGTSTDDVEDKVQNEEFTTGPISDGINMICSSTNEGKMHKEEVTESLGCHENIVVRGTDDVEEKTIEETMADATSSKFSLVTSTDSVEERKDEETTADPTLLERSAEHTIDNIDERKNEEPVLDPTTTTATIRSIGDVEGKKQNEETTADPSSGECNGLPGTDNAEAENKKEKGDIATTGPATTNVVKEIGETEDMSSKEISTIESTDDLKRAADQNEEIADKEMVMDSDKNHVSLKVLLADKNVETKDKEKKTSTKERVLSFRRRTSKDNASPVKPGSPKVGSGQQDWNSPARLPVEKKPKGRKQQWVPFICCSSVQ
ncbi:hypothetical protein SEVIR_6G226400v4 [Setaria viridis]|uniref:Uncharacterized protein n=2 Tax=Setaria viridis TaxID=4556 RepID=A0A4U6UCN9_SETVI|nr:uncharacterized protein LOC117862219 [Setaria viridis]TKW11329.1 hypothetical protein SEVIR_6G226400v2 [Setaria viridis]